MKPYLLLVFGVPDRFLRWYLWYSGTATHALLTPIDVEEYCNVFSPIQMRPVVKH